MMIHLGFKQRKKSVTVALGLLVECPSYFRMAFVLFSLNLSLKGIDNCFKICIPLGTDAFFCVAACRF